MGITSALVLYSVIWCMTLLCIAPLKLKTQADVGQVLPGTQSGSLAEHHLKAKALITTGIATVLFVGIAGIILSGWITVQDLDWFGRMGPAPLTAN